MSHVFLAVKSNKVRIPKSCCCCCGPAVGTCYLRRKCGNVRRKELSAQSWDHLSCAYESISSGYREGSSLLLLDGQTDWAQPTHESWLDTIAAYGYILHFPNRLVQKGEKKLALGRKKTHTCFQKKGWKSIFSFCALFHLNDSIVLCVQLIVYHITYLWRIKTVCVCVTCSLFSRKWTKTLPFINIPDWHLR